MIVSCLYQYMEVRVKLKLATEARKFNIKSHLTVNDAMIILNNKIKTNVCVNNALNSIYLINAGLWAA